VCKALSHANAKGKGIDSKGWVGNQVFRLVKERRERKERKESEISGRDLRKPFWEFKTVNSC